jgi:superoxide dismutase, Cu-Zn family
MLVSTSPLVSRSFLVICVISLSLFPILVGCHQDNPPSQQAAAAVPPPTPATDRSQIHADAATAQATLLSDAAAVKSATNPVTPDAAAATAPSLVAIAHMTPSKSATTKPVNNDVTGTVTFTQSGDKVLVVVDISGLEPNTRHGIHIHEKGDLSDPGLMSTGGHWNPDHHIHGGPSTSPVHAGDLGNLDADANGKAHLELTLSNISVGGMKNDVIGHAVIIHAKADDLSSQPSGNAGARVAGGIIELATTTQK